MYMNDERLRPLTKGMKELLQKMASNERNNLPPLPMRERHAKGLFTRGLIDARQYKIENKMIMSIFLNDKGKAYLQNEK